jgi:hypothetical protein
MSEKEFINRRVEIFLDEIERALVSGQYTPAGAEEMAFKESMQGLHEGVH